MKTIYCVLFMSLITIKIQAQGVVVAKEFGENIKMYTLTDSIEYLDKVEKVCNAQDTRISDDLMMALVKRSTYPQNSSYMINTFLNLIEKDSLYIEFYDFQIIDEREIIQGHRQGKDSHVEFVICRVKVRGTLSLDTKDLICVRNGKITLITKYQDANKQLSTE